MTSSSDLEQIESRIVSLVKDFAFLHVDDSVASSCKPIADMVAMQAVTSSEGGKRLRALLTLDFVPRVRFGGCAGTRFRCAT